MTDPVVLLISRRQVEQQDLASVLDSLKVFTASREDAWRVMLEADRMGRRSLQTWPMVGFLV